MHSLTIATDGACSGNPGPAGWGFISDDGNLTGYGSEASATNQRMELMAAARALYAAGRDKTYYGSLDELVILTDSRYLVDGMTKKWYVGWERRGWKNAQGQPVKNLKIWMTIVKLTKAWEAKGTRVRYEWVKGHSGHVLNEAADQLAVKGRDEAKAARDSP